MLSTAHFPGSVLVFMYLSVLGVTPVTSQEEWSSVVNHVPKPSISITAAPEQRSRVKRTSFGKTQCREESISNPNELSSLSVLSYCRWPPWIQSHKWCVLFAQCETTCSFRTDQSLETLLLLRMSSRCQRRSATFTLLGNWSTTVPEPWLIFSVGVPSISSETREKNRKTKCWFIQSTKWNLMPLISFTQS